MLYRLWYTKIDPSKWENNYAENLRKKFLVSYFKFLYKPVSEVEL